MATTNVRTSNQVYVDADFNLNSKKASNMATCTAGTDGANKDYVDNAVSGIIAAADAMVFKGTVGTGGTYTIAAFNALATYNAGWTYRVIEAGTIKGNVCEVGDLIVAMVDRAGTGNVDADFTVAQTNLEGKATGAEVDTGTNDTKYATPKAIRDSGVISTAAANEFAGVTAKATPVDADTYLYEDSAASGAKKTFTWANVKAALKTYFDTLYDWATVVHAATAKTTPVDADELGIVDSAASNVLKKVTFANLKATLKSYFDTLYSSNTQGTRVVRSAVSGTINGSNTTFTITTAGTAKSGMEEVFKNGLLMNAGAGNDYTITYAANLITIVFATAPSSTPFTDVILVNYHI